MTRNKSEGVSMTSYLNHQNRETQNAQTNDVWMFKGSEYLNLSLHLFRHFQLFNLLLA